MSKSLVRPFKCSACSRPFTRQENLKRHVQTHHPSDISRAYACPQCDAQFSRSDLRKRHIRNCHPSIESILPMSPWPVLDDDLFCPSARSRSSIQDADDAEFYFGFMNPPVTRVPESIHCNIFFAKFHPTMPTLHEPTFMPSMAPKPLLSAVACIGSLYGSAESSYATSKKYFEEGYKSLEEYTRKDRSRFQETWVLQAYILFEMYGIYVCDDSLFRKAQNIHRHLVGAIRELQMTHDGHGPRIETSESDNEDGPATLQSQWETFIQQETRKRCIYSIYLLDSQLSITCNLRPLISALEIKYELPCRDDLWSARTSGAWDSIRSQLFTSFNDQDDEYGSDEAAPVQGSLYENTQDLLHRETRRDLPTLRLLWYSPFAALVLVTQLQMMGRELTHASCLLERPKDTQRNLSVLTERQYGQISQALRNIADLIPKENPSMNTKLSTEEIEAHPENAALWHSFWMTWHYTSITISHPDSLLVTGVVESNLPAAIATAGHLARPRRKEDRDIYEDRDVFRILNDLESSLVNIGHGPMQTGAMNAALENPFITLLGFKICLVGWRIVRLTMGDMASKMEPGGSWASQSRFNPSKFVLQSIMASTRKPGASNSSTGNGGLATGIEVEHETLLSAELRYLQWVRRALLGRSVWPVGKWEAAIVEESLAVAVEFSAVMNARSDVR